MGGVGELEVGGRLVGLVCEDTLTTGVQDLDRLDAFTRQVHDLLANDLFPRTWQLVSVSEQVRRPGRMAPAAVRSRVSSTSHRS